MDMRHYDPAIARWVVQDPVTHHAMSPYNAFDNNPVLIADPSGADGAQNIVGSYGWDTMFFAAAGDSGETQATAVNNVENSDNQMESSQDDLEEEEGTVHLDEVVVTLGNEGSYDLAALLISLQIHGTTYYDYLGSVPGEYGAGEIVPIEVPMTIFEVSPLLGGIYKGGITGIAALWRMLTKGKDVAKVSSRIVNTSLKQLQKKFKHAADFGIKGNFSKANAIKFNSAINKHINNPAVKTIQGTYRGNPVIHYVNPNTGLNVITGANGTFISGWKLNSAQLQNVLKRGKL